MNKIKKLHKYFTNWYVRIFERLGLVRGEITYITRDPQLLFTFRAKKHVTPLWILEDMLYHDPYNDSRFSLGSNPVILDFGANLGFFSVTEAAKYPSARIYAYEAHSDNYEYLVQNITQNNFEKRVRAVHAAVVGSPQKTVTIYENADDVGSHSLIHDKQGLTDVSQEVTAITFADVLRTQGLDAVNLLKMDIEGGEYDVIRHSREALQKVQYIALEHHVIPGVSVEELKDMLILYGFDVYEHSSHIWHCVNTNFVKK